MKVKCSQCGFEYEGNFCSNCGAPLKQVEGPKREQPQVTSEVPWTEKCPVCQTGKLEERTQKGLFGLRTSTNLICKSCGAVFSPDGNDYKLTGIASGKPFPVWQEYNKQSLAPEEWKRISYGGVSDAKQREADMEEYLTSLKEGKTSIKFTIEGGSSSVILKPNEELQVQLPNIALWEPRSVRTTTGGYGGPSFRVAKGVYFRVGAFGARSQSHDELKELDQGCLTLTNRRLTYTGAKRTSEINLNKIISIEPYSDGIAVEVSNRSKVQYFVGLDQEQISTTVTINQRSYSEPFTGLVLKYMIEGLLKRQEGAPATQKKGEVT